MLIEIFSQKLIVSNVILTFLDYLKHNIFFNHGGQHRAPPLFKVSGSAPETRHFHSSINHQAHLFHRTLYH